MHVCHLKIVTLHQVQQFIQVTYKARTIETYKSFLHQSDRLLRIFAFPALFYIPLWILVWLTV